MADWGNGILTHEHDGGSWQTGHPSVSVMMLVMSVLMTIRTGQCAAHSAAWLTWMSATGLAQRHPPPEVGREFAHFLWKRHRLIEIGQELPKHSSSCHLFLLPSTFCSIVPRSHVLAACPGYSSMKEEFAVRACDCL
jgi:hypothetical protein